MIYKVCELFGDLAPAVRISLLLRVLECLLLLPRDGLGQLLLSFALFDN